MNLLDFAIVAIVVVAIAHGATQGAAIQLLSFGGFWGGLALGALLAPVLSGLVDSPFAKAFVSLMSLFGFAAIVGGVGRQLGVHTWATLRRLRLGVVDAIVGAGVTAVATLVAVWLVVILAAEGPLPSVARLAQDSAIAGQLVRTMPPAPTVFTRIQALVNTTPFPRVFTGFEPRPQPVPLPDDPTVRSAVAAAGASTVRVFGPGCGGIQTGTGFFAAPGLVVTNAHVVAGLDVMRVETREGSRGAATPVLFDPNLDVAVLRVRGIAAAALPVIRTTVPRGTGGAVIGYPAGGPFTAGAGAVLASFEAVGRDIYGSAITRRQVYQLQARVRPGNSGGPFVDANGDVVGVIFAASTSDRDVGYALTGGQVAARIDQARARSATVDTGACAA